MLAQHMITEFWDWFQEVCNQLGERFENQCLIDELDARIARLGTFGWEIGPGVQNDHNNAFVLTPSGDLDLLIKTREIIKAAPVCPGWEFYPAKPAKKWQRKFILLDDDREISVNASDARYVLRQYADGIFDLLLADQNIAVLTKPLQETAAEILIDGEIGEELRMQVIKKIDIVTQFDTVLQQKSSSIESLTAHLKAIAK
jgi:hypothetical protein